MNPFVFGIKEPDHGWLEPTVHEILRLARQEAFQREASEVSREHFLLATLVQNDEHAINLLMALGLEPAAVRGRILDRLGPLGTEDDDSDNVPLSQELHICVDQAVAAAHASGIDFVAPEHLLISVLSNQWKLSSDKLVERLGAIDEWQALLPVCIELAHQERRTMFYIQNLVHFLSHSQEPAMSLNDLTGQKDVKEALRAIIEQVKNPPASQEKRLPQEIQLIGAPYTTGRLLAEAVAYEMGTRLLSFSFAGLATMCAPFATYMEVKRKDQGFSTHNSHFSRYGIALAQHILQRFFFRAHHMSPCILLIEDIEVSNFSGHTRLDAICDHLLSLLFAEIEQLTEGGQIIILATTVLGIDIAFQRLELKGMLHTKHFERRLLLDEDSNSKHGPTTVLCPFCTHRVALDWKHCVYCGASLTNICPRCGIARWGNHGANFCFECGFQFEE